jgi:hypothetical protein
MNQGIKISKLTFISWLFKIAVCWSQTSVYTPPPGSPERQEIMDVMRLDFYRADPIRAHRNPDRVFNIVIYLKVHGDWALTEVQPVDAAGKEIAEPRWGLLYRKAGKWTDVDYDDAIERYPANDFDANDMTSVAIRNIQRAFPHVPKDIFPRHP